MRTNGTPAIARKRGKGQTPGTDGLSHLAVPKLKPSTVILSATTASQTTQPATQTTGNSADGKENQPSRLASAAPNAACRSADVQPSLNHRRESPQQAKNLPNIRKQHSLRPASADNALLTNSTESRSRAQVHLRDTAAATASTNCAATGGQASSIEAMQQKHDAPLASYDAMQELPLACQTAINKRR